MRKFAKMDINIIIAGITTRSTGQFKTEIDIMIAIIEHPVTIDWLIKLGIYVSRDSVSLLKRFKIRPYGTVSKNSILARITESNIFF